ncbi:glutathione S-transferase family protein [Lysobacter pythonis]|uniref:Glutathione S-transferase family protein n=1 Tax=Solilutibacter pythonis TaxID=2483112 RepID=A0A3M2I2T4_9GAMM|nr:glutathione S-transferase N-terminal domain-containing protein [Lysobacter pythonis]RMH93542.1 glutathione S-transferase family protein [Lysobacter pythonis]
MKLYSKPGACSTADHIALQWTGQPFEVQLVSQAEIKEPGFLEINPAGTVPVLVDGDFVLTQNAAILGYIADSYPEAGLAGDGSPRQRAEATRWLAFCNSDLHPAFTPLFAPGLFMQGSEHYETVKTLARKRVRRHYETVDQRLGETGDWLAGFRSFADPYLYVTMGWAKKLGIALDDLPHLSAFHQRMSADLGVQAALKAEGLL